MKQAIRDHKQMNSRTSMLTRLVRQRHVHRTAIALILISLLSAGCKESNAGTQGNNSDAISRNSYSEQSNSNRETIEVTHSANELSVKIRIPPAHHAYLDSGKEGNLIPISFDWESLIKKGYLPEKPALIKKPAGQFDKTVEATVLRGTGLFVFTAKKKQWPSGKLFKVLTQICNERTGQCYPPSNKPVKIP